MAVVDALEEDDDDVTKLKKAINTFIEYNYSYKADAVKSQVRKLEKEQLKELYYDKGAIQNMVKEKKI